MPQLLSANGRRSGGRHIDSAVNDAASGANANKRGIAGLVFANIELRPTSLRHFLASSSTRRIAAVAPTACYCWSETAALVHARTRFDSTLVVEK